MRISETVACTPRRAVRLSTAMATVLSFERREGSRGGPSVVPVHSVIAFHFFRLTPIIQRPTGISSGHITPAATATIGTVHTRSLDEDQPERYYLLKTFRKRGLFSWVELIK